VEQKKYDTMKRMYLLSAFILLGSLVASAQEKVNWLTIEDAARKSLEEPRIMVIDVYTDWCGWCKRQDATTFTDPEVVRILNEQFYPVKLNAESREDIVLGSRTYKFVDSGSRGYHEVAAIVTNGRLVYPTISYLSEEGKILKVSPGYKDASALKVYLSWFTSGAYLEQGFDEYKFSLPEDGIAGL
jgi:thioredoxin-related protein